jgi:hypothetical protein
LPAHAQDNYEIQVYGADTVPPNHLMVELHSNYTLQGSKQVVDGVRPSNHAWHETLEITRGPIGNFDPLHDQQQQIVPAIDLNVSPDWEFNFGVGVGVTH